MGDASTTAAMAPTASQSRDLEELLNTIDQMRSQGVAGHVDLPQAIVVGDQSSGKSSVLEAICGVKFPVGDSLCTRFATEFILRRSPDETLAVSIVPDIKRPAAEQTKLAAFEHAISRLDDFPKVVAAAGKSMGIDEGSKTFSNDVLRVEISGPKQPHLTLVDLPGLFHAASSRQTEADRKAVTALVSSYMHKTRSIILAVVSAKNDLNNQIVTKLARSIDVDGHRTLGIITKPDLLHKGSNSEKEFYALAQNKEVKFDLGWHIVVNRDFDTRDSTTEQRDIAELKFFSKGIWATLSKSQVGIESLRARVSRVLRNQILSELPGLIAEVETGVTECNKTLSLLGVSRGSLREQRSYLHHVAEEFSNLIKAAVKGDYDAEFFGDPETTEGYERRLRAVAQNALDDYSDTMRTKGHKWHLVENDSAPATNKLLHPGRPKVITVDDYLKRVSAISKNSRGLELRGTHRAEIIGVLFRDQCSPWKDITLTTADDIFTAARMALIMALDACADQTTAEGIIKHIVNPALEKVQEALESKTQAQLKTHTEGHPITFNHYFTENVQNLRNEHKRKYIAKKLRQFFGKDPETDNNFVQHNFSVKSLLDALSGETEADMDKFACSESTFIMRAYYKVAMKTMVDKFATDAIEECLMTQLATIFNAQTVLNMEDGVIEEIAGETEESKMERSSSSQKLKVLQAALNALRRLDKHKPNDNEQKKKQKAATVVNGVGEEADLEECKEVKFPSRPAEPESPGTLPGAPKPLAEIAESPMIDHPFFSLPPVKPARGPMPQMYRAAKKNPWPRPIKPDDQEKRRSRKFSPCLPQLSCGMATKLVLRGWIIANVSKVFYLAGLLLQRPLAEADLRALLLKLFFFEDMPNTLEQVIAFIEVFGGRKSWSTFDADHLQTHRSTRCWTLETLFNGWDREQIAATFEANSGIRVQRD